MKYVHIIRCEDATNLGGPMGTEYTTTKWEKHFLTKRKALAFANRYLKPYKGVLESHGARDGSLSCDIGHEIISYYKRGLR